MNAEIFYALEELSTVQDRLDRIGEYYAQGKKILDGIEAYEVASVLGVDIDGFSPSEDWEITAEPNNSPEEADLEQNTADEVISFLYRSDIDRERLAKLEKIAEVISSEDDDYDEEGESVLERLGLSDEEIGKALEGARECILEGDGGWTHVAVLHMKARNGWLIRFWVNFDDATTDQEVEMISPKDQEFSDCSIRLAETRRLSP
jgi:hypothetical protein